MPMFPGLTFICVHPVKKTNPPKISIIKKDGTLEAYDISKVVIAIKKSAARMLIELTQEEIDFIESMIRPME